MIRALGASVVISAGLGLLATPSWAFEVGSHYDCPSVADGPVVRIWVGQVDSAASAEVVSVALWPIDAEDGPSVGHSPFAADALSACSLIAPPGTPLDVDRFREGYDLWWAAFQNNEAGMWSVAPSEAYGIMLGVLGQ